MRTFRLLTCLLASTIAAGSAAQAEEPNSSTESVYPFHSYFEDAISQEEQGFRLIALVEDAQAPEPVAEPDLRQPELPPRDIEPSVRNIEPSRQFGQAPTNQQRRSPPITFLRNQAVLLKKGDLQYDIGFLYSYDESDSPILLGGGPAVAESIIRKRDFVVPLTFRYGVTKNLQATIFAPIGGSHEQFIIPGIVDIKDNDGPTIGDIVLGLSYALPKCCLNDSDFIWTNFLRIPTGTTPSLAIRPAAGLGGGNFEIGSSILAIQRYDPLLVFGGCGLSYGFEREIEGFEVKRGFGFDYRLGVGFGVNEKLSLSTQFIGRYEQEIEIDGASISGSDRDLLSLRFAITKAERCVNTEPFIQIGLTEPSPEAQLGVIWTFK